MPVVLVKSVWGFQGLGGSGTESRKASCRPASRPPPPLSERGPGGPAGDPRRWHRGALAPAEGWRVLLSGWPGQRRPPATGARAVAGAGGAGGSTLCSAPLRLSFSVPVGGPGGPGTPVLWAPYSLRCVSRVRPPPPAKLPSPVRCRQGHRGAPALTCAESWLSVSHSQDKPLPRQTSPAQRLSPSLPHSDGARASTQNRVTILGGGSRARLWAPTRRPAAPRCGRHRPRRARLAGAPVRRGVQGKLARSRRRREPVLCTPGVVWPRGLRSQARRHPRPHEEGLQAAPAAVPHPSSRS